MDTPIQNQRTVGAEKPSWRERLFGVRVGLGATALILFGWPLWVMCLFADAWVGRKLEEGGGDESF